MTMRGVKKPGSHVVTSANRGIFRDSEPTRLEFFAALGDDRR
jgi:GTP cyclohydrolase I